MYVTPGSGDTRRNLAAAPGNLLTSAAATTQPPHELHELTVRGALTF